MSQRESPTTDRATPHVPALSPPIVPTSHPCPVSLEAELRQFLAWSPAGDCVPSPQRSFAQVLDQLHTGRSFAFPAYESPSSPVTGASVEDCQQGEAVARALSTPDLFLIQGAPGTGKTVVASRILREAAARGLRVLFLASTPAALDQALCRGLEQPGLPVLRWLHEDEQVEQLPPCVRQVTLTERLRQFAEHLQEPLKSTGRRCSEELASLEKSRETLTAIGGILHSEQEISNHLQQAQSRREQLPTTVESETYPEQLAPYWEALQQTRREVAQRQADLHDQLTLCQQREQSHREELDRLKPLLEARQANRWWSPNFWRTTGKGDVVNQAQTLEQTCQELQATVLQTQEIIEQLQARLVEQTQAATQALERLRADLDAAVQRHRADLQGCQNHWQTLVATLPEALRPAQTLAALDQSARTLEEVLARVQSEAAQAEQRRLELEQVGLESQDHLIRATPIVATTVACWSHNADSPTQLQALDFDLLVVEEADQVTEADLRVVAERTKRWILIGESSSGNAGSSEGTRPGPRLRPQNRPSLRPGLFHRLWTELHDDPSLSHAGWRQDLDRLVCVLVNVPPEQRRWIQSESVIDHPDILLHIWSPPDQVPSLAAVEFPAGTPIDEAKVFLLRELDELPLQTRARGIFWEETTERIVAHLGGELPGKSSHILLGDGIHETAHLLAGHWQTSRLEFERPRWSRTSAVAWVHQQLRLKGHERTLLLDRPRRACPALAGWLADLLTDGIRSALVPTPCVEFVTVPSLGEDRQGQRYDPPSRNTGVATLAPRLRSLRGGAGVEINLAEPRRHDLLPRELRDILPERGLVNYLEAQAVVRLIRELLEDADTRAEVLTWQDSHPANNPGIAVLALYPAQVQLIRYLLESVPLGAVRVEVALPEQMRQRECAIALVSLTRSHLHRAVTYGEGPAQLMLALTRPARRLILIGDPGTLQRRSQYPDPVDHLDVTESEQEQSFAGRLVRYLQGHGMLQRAFVIRELSGL